MKNPRLGGLSLLKWSQLFVLHFPTPTRHYREVSSGTDISSLTLVCPFPHVGEVSLEFLVLSFHHVVRAHGPFGHPLLQDILNHIASLQKRPATPQDCWKRPSFLCVMVNVPVPKGAVFELSSGFFKK